MSSPHRSNVVAKRMLLFEIIDTLSTDCQTALGISDSDSADAIMPHPRKGRAATALSPEIEIITERHKL